MMKISIPILSALLLLATAAEAATQPKKFSRTLASITCEAEVLNTLGSLETPLEWVDTSPAGSDLHVLRSETNTRNVTLELGTSKSKTRLKRIDLRTVVQYDYDAEQGCTPVLSVHALNESRNLKGVLFTDFNLQKILDASATSGKAHVIYVWSPRMNLSLKGVKEISSYAETKKIDLTVIADPMANPDEVRQIVMRNRWPSKYEYKLDSDILKQHNATIHFPALLIVKDGKIAAPVRPGYDTPDRLDKFLVKMGVSK